MKIKNIVIYLIVFIIILVSFMMPEVLLKIEENKMEGIVYEKKSQKNQLYVDAENIYLVKAIHDIEKINAVEITSSEKIEWVLVEKSFDEEKDEYVALNELKKLEDYNILKLGNIENYSFTVINKLYHNDKEQYIINNILLMTNNRSFNFEIEAETKKILKIYLETNDIEDREELMLNFIKYLNLYIIDDWKYEDEILKSEKAKLAVKLENIDDKYVLSINSSERIY